MFKVLIVVTICAGFMGLGDKLAKDKRTSFFRRFGNAQIVSRVMEKQRVKELQGVELVLHRVKTIVDRSF